MRWYMNAVQPRRKVPCAVRIVYDRCASRKERPRIAFFGVR